MKKTNYKKLLQKYIEHVSLCTHDQCFLQDYYKTLTNFSDAEWRVLKSIQKKDSPSEHSRLPAGKS